MITFIIVILYLVGAVVTYGTSFAFFQTRCSERAEECYKDDRLFSIIIGMVWIIAISDIETLKDLSDSYKKNGMKFY